jgi:hypothetical protein
MMRGSEILPARLWSSSAAPIPMDLRVRHPAAQGVNLPGYV